MSKLTMLNSYSKSMFEIMKKLFPDVEEEKLKDRMREIILENFSTDVVTASGKELNGDIPINKIDKFVAQNEPIMASSGTFFKRHDQKKNILADMCDEFMTKRKVYKKEMFKHINDEDKSIYNNFDSLQKNMKILNNSFYGASAEPNSIFYNPIFGPSITALGRDIITTAINAFETFLSNTIEFRDITDIFIFCENILKENYKNPVVMKKTIEKQDLIDYFKERTIDKTDINLLNIYLDTVDTIDFYKFYYKNNFKEFMNDTDILDNYFSKIIDRKDFLDPNNPPEDMKEIMEKIWNILSDWVFYNYQNFFRAENASNHKRKSVITVDTDSNFIYLKPYLDFFMEKFPDRINMNDNNHLISIINLITYQLTHVINETCLKFTEDNNVPESVRSRLNFKNEFCLQRIMLTPNKKNYASILLMQEGNIFNNPKLDIKGLPIRKVSVNKNIRDYYTEILENDILKEKNINLSKIIGKYKELENIVSNSLSNGEINYVIPSKVNEIESYKLPYQIMAVRGTIAWNILYPNKEITMPNKINLIKLDIPSYDYICEYIKNFNNNYSNYQKNFDPIDVDEYMKKINKIYSNEKMVKDGFNVIAIPQTEKKIPDFLIGLIDVKTMTNDNIKPGIIMLKSLGFKTLDVLTKQFPTNILSI